MACVLRDNYLQARLEQEQKRRGDSTAAATMKALLIERLTQLDIERRQEQRSAAPAKA